MDSSLLVRIFGHRATLIHGDTLVLDRWRWLRKHLPAIPTDSMRLLDVGCGTGAFTIGAARLGYAALGLSWDERNQRVAQERAALCKAPLASFEVQDVRFLDQRTDLIGKFDIVVCCENIEHVLDDSRLMLAMTACLKQGGTLLLTSPNFHFRPMTKGDNGPYLPIENGGHVRRGYTQEDFVRLCADAGLHIASISFCSGLLSQKITALMRVTSKVHPMIGWAVILPLRWMPPLLDPILEKYTDWPGFSITLVAKRM